MENKLPTINDWMTMDREIKPAYVDQILPAEPGEFIMISGRTGIGKSILVMHLAFCLATGTSFFGFKCSKVNVGMLAMEGGIENIKDRLCKIMAKYPNCNDTLRFDLREPTPLTTHIDYFKQVFSGCKVVILDNLRQVTTGKYLENNYAAEWLKVYQHLLTEIGAVGILTHHIKKPNGNKDSIIDVGDVYNLKGATEYVDASTSVLLLERARQSRSNDGRGFGKVDNNMLQLYFAKHRIETRELPAYLTLKRDYKTASFILQKEGK